MAEVLGRVRKAGVGMVELPQMNVEVESSPMDVMDLENVNMDFMVILFLATVL